MADLVAGLRAQLAVLVQHSLAQYGSALALLARTNPQGQVTSLLGRPDAAGVLVGALARSQAQALASMDQAWLASGGPADGLTRQQLRQDVTRAYAEAPGLIRDAVIRAWHSVPDQHFIPGVTEPGTHPGADVAAQRAEAVAAAVAGQAQALALRNGLSVDVAASSGRTAAILASAPPGSRLRWRASMNGKDPRSCAWCRALHGTVVPAGSQFPHPAEIGGHKPPRVYRGVLHGPPLHPHCQCELEVIPPEAAEPEPLPLLPEPEEESISSDDIRALPEERYQSLTAFLRSALHELAQVIKAILGIGG